jgi:DNA polymerase-3 subunit delta
MDYTTLQRNLKTSTIHSLYLLHGEEPYLLMKYQEEILAALLSPEERVLNLAAFDQDPPLAELISISGMFPFFGGRNVVLMRNTHLFSAAQNVHSKEKLSKKDEELLHFLQTIPEQTVVLFVSYDKVDKRRKIFKQVLEQGAVVEVLPLKGRELKNWLEKRIVELGQSIRPDALEHILTTVSFMTHPSLSYLDQELTKIALYVGDRKVITNDDVNNLLATVPEMSVFTMVEAMSQKNTHLALDVLGEQIAIGQAGLRLLALLARQIRHLYQTKVMTAEGFGSKEIGSHLKLPPFVTDKLIKQSCAFSVIQLKTALGLLNEADHNLKLSRGLVSLEKIIIYLCG